MILDGPMGTALELSAPAAARAGLTHPSEVRELHRRYVDAGAQALLTHTTALPWAVAQGEKEEARWLEAALACAEGLGAEIWIALGPGIITERALTWAAAAAREGRARGVWFETWSAAQSVALAAATAATQAMRLEYVVTFLPQTTAAATEALIEGERGAVAVGLNCGLPLMQLADAQALAGARLSPGQKRVLKPAAAFADKTLAPAGVVALADAAKADWVGVCCGGTAAHVRALASRA
jgi:methionine synthase I (cobalamin-dependent)